jgi:hypothetical protein
MMRRHGGRHGMPVHPVCGLFPLMSEADLMKLQEDIKENGLKLPIVIHEGQVLDGRDRLNACVRAGVEPRFEEWDGRGSLVKFS